MATFVLFPGAGSRQAMPTDTVKAARRRHQPDLQGLIPKIQKSMLSKDVDAMQPHIRAFVER